MPTCPLSSPSHQSYCESVFVVTVMRSPTAKLRSPGCCPVNACMAVTTRAPPDAPSVNRIKRRDGGELMHESLLDSTLGNSQQLGHICTAPLPRYYQGTALWKSRFTVNLYRERKIHLSTEIMHLINKHLNWIYQQTYALLYVQFLLLNLHLNKF